MKCPMCDGMGTSNVCVNGTFKTCAYCNGKGEVENLCDTCGTICPFEDEHSECEAYSPQTNEGWFTSLSTEEKAKFIFWQHFDVYGKTLYELMVNASRGVSRDKQAEVMIVAVVEWLKQPHSEVAE